MRRPDLALLRGLTRAAVWFWWGSCALLRRVWLSLAHVNDPWDGGTVDLTHPQMRKCIAQARLDRMRSAGTMVCWTYSRDRVVERRGLRCESPAEKAARLERAFKDRYPLRMVV